jgi:hypothetical protein
VEIRAASQLGSRVKDGYDYHRAGSGWGIPMAKPKKRQKPPVKPIDPRDVFELAYRFCLADEHIRDKNNTRAPIMAAPAMVISAFACELLLKCLLLIENGEIVQTHRLDKLFQQLSHPQKRRIDAMWETKARPRIDGLCRIHGLPSDLANALVTCGQAFERMRYGYEDPDSQRFYIADLPRILCELIVEARPEWRTVRFPETHSVSIGR